MASVETSMIIHSPLERVFNFLMDTTNVPKWMPKVNEVIVDGPMGLGTHGTEIRSFLGRTMKMEWEVIEYEPYCKVTFHYQSGPLPAIATFTFEKVSDGTRVACQTNIEGRGIFRLLMPMVVREAKKEDETNFSNLKRVLEDEHYAPLDAGTQLSGSTSN
jgi:uncharacterized protein YndB with AHSA1/START domain